MDKRIDMRYLHDDPKLQSWLPDSIKDDKEKEVEIERWKSLTREERYQEIKEYRNNFSQRMDKKTADKEALMIENAKNMYVNTDSVNSLENSEATVLWLITMGVGFIFNERFMIWIVATAIWLTYIFRYKIREHKWDNGGKEEYFKQFDELNKNGGSK